MLNRVLLALVACAVTTFLWRLAGVPNDELLKFDAAFVAALGLVVAARSIVRAGGGR